MIRRTFLVAALTLAGGLIVGTPDARAADAPATQITIDNFSFSPAQLTVAPGTRVTWTNHDDIPHTIVDGDNPRAMKSPPLDTDDSFAFTFDKPGTYHYFCSLHPHMRGTVVVK
ncbi:MAG TPA: cupredoxin family copper-binding protein [Stellaceae bacterium]|nr:cupredoxin family copper-binding protein [Stellaceae bacterium]